MDQTCFAVMTHLLSRIPSRRDVLRGLVRAGLGLGIVGIANPGDARKKRKKKKIKRNDFDCVNVGGFCRNKGQCCSGICQGQKDQKRCQAHDTGGCQAEQDYCVDTHGTAACPDGPAGGCFRTTGNASFCGEEGPCMACAKDTECEALFGPGAACVVCVACSRDIDTSCVPAAL